MKIYLLFLSFLFHGIVAKNRQKYCKMSAYGSDYTGNINTTITGRECQRWDSQSPQTHPWGVGEYFPDGDLNVVGNNCRNPDFFDEGPWCYTTHPGERWEHCEIPTCHDMPECRMTDIGTEYRGSESVSNSGSACLEWQGEYEQLDQNFCRNPDSKEGGPWCFVEENEWEYCTIPFCKPSASCITSGTGDDYVGTVAVTETGRFCQRWDLQWPHQHTYTGPSYFPEDTLEDVEDYCRNPINEEERPWCFTTNPDIRWEYCSLPQCEDCKYNDAAKEYAGTLSETTDGHQCQRWDSQDPHPHPFTDSDRFPDASLSAAGSMCRNPDGRTGGPWCYTTDPDTEWQFCDIPFCDGDDYVGTVAVTETGRFCQRWDLQWPHQHTYTDPSYFPEDTLEDVEDYCRNPINEEERPWCFTTNPDIRWEYCSLPQCEDCKYNDAAKEYAGTLSETTDGHQCQRWDSQDPHPHPFTDSDRFPDASLSAAGSMCRNPDGRTGGPWCYTTDPDTEWQFCDIPFCDAPDCPDPVNETPRPRLAKHVLHIGIDGMDPCFVDAPGGAPNILQRMGDMGSYTIDGARNVITAYSGPNWAAHMASMNVPSTGVTGNGWGPPWRGYSGSITPVTGGNVAFPTIAGHLRNLNENLRVADFYGWDWIVHMASYGNPGTLHKDEYCSTYFDGQDYRVCDAMLIDNTTDYLHDVWLAADTSYTFIYLSELDVVGHSLTWCNEDFLEYMDTTDDQVGLLLDVVDEMDLWDDVLVMLSTDHGGSAYSHGWDDDRDIPIPMFLRGPGIKQNYELKHSVRHFDIGTTAAYALGVKPNPWWDGKVMYEAFEHIQE